MGNLRSNLLRIRVLSVNNLKVVGKVWWCLLIGNNSKSESRISSNMK